MPTSYAVTIGGRTFIRQGTRAVVVRSALSAVAVKYNPHHDAEGRFASGSGGGSSVGLPVGQYMPSKTVRAAQEWATEHGVDADYGRDLQTANWANAAMDRLQLAGRPLPPRIKVSRQVFTEEFGQRTDAEAMYDPGERTIYINPASQSLKQWRNAASDEARRDLNMGELAGNDIHRTFYHEYGHMLHYAADDPATHRRRGMAEISPFTREERAAIHPELRSRYAFTNGNEFIAEVVAGRLTGHQYSDVIMAHYQKWNGPKL